MVKKSLPQKKVRPGKAASSRDNAALKKAAPLNEGPIKTSGSSVVIKDMPLEQKPAAMPNLEKAAIDKKALPVFQMPRALQPVPEIQQLDAGPSETISLPPPTMDINSEQIPDSPQPVCTRPSLYIVMVTPEIAPAAKVGGLADVVFGLARELAIRGNAVEIILPKYDGMRYDHIWGLERDYNDLWVPWYEGFVHCTVWSGFVHGRKCFFIESHSRDNFFNRGAYYGFNDDIVRFAFFSRAAMEFMFKSGKHPDIIHCHDWQTGLVPVFLYEIYKGLGMTHSRVCYTIHNFGHQGVTGEYILRATGLNRPDYFMHYDRLRDNKNLRAVNLMKAGIVYSNFVNTVSNTYAVEAKEGSEGAGLGPTLKTHHIKYGGVVNGIDYAFWNPEIDRYIPA
ncbi:MAG: glycogen/starch synthase, partial [Pseudomonadota bacterium]